MARYKVLNPLTIGVKVGDYFDTESEDCPVSDKDVQLLLKSGRIRKMGEKGSETPEARTASAKREKATAR
jgi:hypothetical protein